MLIPPAGDIALAATVVGVLFLVRFLLTLLRIRRATGRASGTSLWKDAALVTTPQAFGASAEPDRRHAMRQFVVGAVFTAVGLAVASWLLLSSVLSPIVLRGMAV